MSRGGNFKFIHWNLMALPRNIVMQEGSVWVIKKTNIKL
jgi:hypothetical protein